jgi:hypothetical protein
MCKNANMDTDENIEIIIAEFNYIAETAFQANEDRAKVTQFFVISFGGFLTALISAQLPTENIVAPNTILGIFFLLIFLYGGISIFQLARLRMSWKESVLAMNQIKDSSIKKHPVLAEYFRWSNKNAPPTFNPKSLGFSLVVMIVIISGMALGFAVTLLAFAIGTEETPWALSIIFGCIGGAIHIRLYYHLLKDQPIRAKGQI